MEKITPGSPLSQSPDFVHDNIQILKNLFPTIVKEGKIDIEELKALLGQEIEEEEEYYRFTWAGKSNARREANKPSTATLRPDLESSKDWDTTQNIFIEGDNLEVLKLLQKSYSNKIKMIYIDVPYNTGKDFVYKDNYNDNLGNYLAITGQLDDEGKRTTTNSESDGRFHSNWLNMMYPRLKLARNLLSDDGVIFISIDDNELYNLRKVCDEIFGEVNFEANIIPIVNPGGRDYKQIAVTNEYLLVYSKTEELVLNEIAKEVAFTFNDILGGYNTRELRNRNPKFHSGNRPNLFYPFYVNAGEINTDGYCLVSLERSEKFNIEVKPYNSQGKESVWRWGKDKAKVNISTTDFDSTQILAKIKNDGNWNIYEKNRRSTSKVKSVWDETEMRTENGTRALRSIFENTYFDHPKPIDLIKKCAIIGSNESDIILDFFAGSGTTAQAIMQLNSEDGGARKFICVQLPEQTDENSEAYKAGYFKISDITKERIRRAGEKIKNETNKDLFTNDLNTIDIGFRSFKLDSSNLNAWDGDPENLEKTLFNASNNIKEGRSENDVLYEILLKFGLDLTQPIDKKTIATKTVYTIGAGTLFICLGDDLTTDIAEGIGKWKNELQPVITKVIFKDNGFSDVEKTNCMQILKRFGIEEVNTI
jgi:adenine-specific DNA-methyltransferase